MITEELATVRVTADEWPPDCSSPLGRDLRADCRRQFVRLSRSEMAYPMEPILEDISPEVATIDVATVLLAGELDQVDSSERHETKVLAYLPNAEFKIIKASGHLIPIDEPVQLAKDIASFTARLAG
jgi:pimeloyl-ACP methyl ester carboxylesterase